MQIEADMDLANTAAQEVGGPDMELEGTGPEAFSGASPIVKGART